MFEASILEAYFCIRWKNTLESEQNDHPQNCYDLFENTDFDSVGGTNNTRILASTANNDVASG